MTPSATTLTTRQHQTGTSTTTLMEGKETTGEQEEEGEARQTRLRTWT